ncbi:MAG: RnfABCDGE type electron transport complex subunit D [Massiliimalia sp.]
MDRLFVVTPSPHITSKRTTATIMRDVVIALMPALVASVIFFGLRALLVEAVCVVSCILFEYLSRRVMKRENTISDWSAVVTGLLLAYNLPVSIPLWMAVLGSFFAIVIVKQLFGGIGQNFANPAITARIFLFVSFAGAMTTWMPPFYYSGKVDAVSVATPLTDIAAANTLDLFLGNVPGCLGETSALALLIGGIYLVVRKIISPAIPAMYLGTVFVLSLCFGVDPVKELFAGGVMLGAIFMATDYSTSPTTLKGKLIFGFGCGLVTICIRVFGNYPEGTSFAILFMNVVCPLIDRYTKTKPFGTEKEKRAKEA